jgi:lipopolysaccharide transport system ATP-binding protein
MFVRLAFAVATSTTPDILIVDEALSVGDEAFQRKCFARIQSIQDRGGTILFVSHSASSVVELCKYAVLMSHGEILLAGSPKIVVSKYHKLIYAPPDKLNQLRQEIRDLNNIHPSNQSENLTSSKEENRNITSRVSKDLSQYDPYLLPQSTISYISRGAKIGNCRIETLEGKLVNILRQRNRYIYKYQVVFDEAADQVRFGMLIKTMSGFELGGATSHTTDKPMEHVAKGSVIEVEFNFKCLLQPGVYFLNTGAVGNIDGSEQYLDRHIDIAMFRVQQEDDILTTGIVDFSVESDVSFVKN